MSLINPLFPEKNILLPPLRTKLDVMKQFVIALLGTGNCFNYICRFFPGISNEKLKAGIFVGPQIRTLMNDPGFIAFMNENQLRGLWL